MMTFFSHRDWLLVIAAHLGLPVDKKLYFSGKTITVDLLLKQSLKQQLMPVPIELTMKFPRAELGFSLEAYAYYINDFSKPYTNAMNNAFSVEDLLRLSLKGPIGDFPESGMHEYIGISAILERQKEQGRGLRGAWKRADRFLNQMILKVRRDQRDDGSLWRYKGGPGRDTYTKALNYTAHHLLWIMRYLPPERLDERWIESALSFLIRALEDVTRDLDGRELVFRRELEQLAFATAVSHAYEALQLYRNKIEGIRTPSE